MTTDILKNYNIFYEMVLLTTLLTNSDNEESDKDSAKIIEFIGRANKSTPQEILDYKKVILEDLRVIATTQDVATFKQMLSDGQIKENAALLQIKSDVIEELNNYERMNVPFLKKNVLDYRNCREYSSFVREKQLEQASISGIICINKIVALCYALGIGVEKDFSKAILRLKQCLMWSDIPSSGYIALIYSLLGDSKNEKLFYELKELLNKYLLGGVTIIPDEDAKSIDKEVIELYNLVSSSMQDVVMNTTELIDYSFVEILLYDKISYGEKMKHINNYQDGSWKNISNSPFESTRIGFDIGGNK